MLVGSAVAITLTRVERTLFAQDQDPARAMAETIDAAREYLKQRSGSRAAVLWSFTEATGSDMIAVMVAHDIRQEQAP